ncbi:MAG: hypothetical protein ACK6DC_09425 [Planctomycetota bacterium]|jgi:hypothetical protein
MTQLDPMTRYLSDESSAPFVERRKRDEGVGGQERRQFGNSYRDLSPKARELAEAVDKFKLENHRRYVTAEELLLVIEGLGYRRDA